MTRWYGDGTFDRRPSPDLPVASGPRQPAALLAWFRDNEPQDAGADPLDFMCKDYVRYRLTGEACAEVTDWSGASLMDIRDARYDSC